MVVITSILVVLQLFVVWLPLIIKLALLLLAEEIDYEELRRRTTTKPVQFYMPFGVQNLET